MLNTMNSEYSTMSREARMRRLGELCSKAVTLFVLDSPESAEVTARSYMVKKRNQGIGADLLEPVLTDDAKAIIVYLRRVGPSSPREICQYTELSRTTVFRRLRELGCKGIVTKMGYTSATKYEIMIPIDRR